MQKHVLLMSVYGIITLGGNQPEALSTMRVINGRNVGEWQKRSFKVVEQVGKNNGLKSRTGGDSSIIPSCLE